MSLDSTQSNILIFWFGEPSSPNYESHKSFWFQSTPELDAQVRELFEDAYKQALNGELDSLSESAEGSLSLILLLDQFPRNMYRGTPGAFLSDPQALKIVKEGIFKKFDKVLNKVQKLFFYMPFQHSESLEDQEASLQLYKTLGQPEAFQYAFEHYEIIKRFGRFPHRNKILGRINTVEELEYLQLPSASSFGQ